MAEVQNTPTPAHEIASQAEKVPLLHFNRAKDVELSSTGWMLPTPNNISISEMRRRYDETGYLWVKKLLAREDVYDMREQ